MGFGFNLGMIFIIFPLLIILLILWAISRRKFFGTFIAVIIIGIMSLIIVSSVLRMIFSTKELDKEDYYGNYVVDRSYFRGKQADWQYEHYWFEIKENDSIYFYCIDNYDVRKTYKGHISTVKPSNSERLVLSMNEPSHHIVKENPTTYRSTWDFYLVFHSEKFGNMFFKKGEWKPLENK